MRELQTNTAEGNSGAGNRYDFGALLSGATVVLSFLVSMLVSLVAGYVLLVLSVDMYPYGALGYGPLSLGLLGMLGLLLAWLGKPERKSVLRLRIEITLLVSGLLGALGFIIAYYWFVRFITSDRATLYAFLCVFPLLPMLVGIGLILRIKRQLRDTPQAGVGQYWRLAALAVLVCLGGVLLRIGAQEAVMAWYGRDLIYAARASAEEIANGAPYCVIDHDGARTFEELDKRRILLDAVEKRLGFRGMNTTWVSAHFGIAVDNRAYWWSFRQRQFLAFPGGADPFLSDMNCPYTR